MVSLRCKEKFVSFFSPKLNSKHENQRLSGGRPKGVINVTVEAGNGRGESSIPGPGFRRYQVSLRYVQSYEQRVALVCFQGFSKVFLERELMRKNF